MAIFNSDEYAKAYVTQPVSKLEPFEFGGRVRKLYASVTLGAELTTADVLNMAKLPANATPLRVHLIAPGGTAGSLELGWAAGEAIEAADADGLIASFAGNAAVDEVMDIANQAAGYNKKFAEEVDVQLVATVNTTGWSGDLVEMEIEYIID